MSVTRWLIWFLVVLVPPALGLVLALQFGLMKIDSSETFIIAVGVYAGWLGIVTGLRTILAIMRSRKMPDVPHLGGVYLSPHPLPEFVGRRDEVKRITRRLKPGSKTAITGVVGMGGLGKTELAKLAAMQVAGRFRDGVLWADCGRQDLVTIADLWAAAYGFYLPGDDEVSKMAAWRGLASGKEALLIFDDVQAGQDIELLIPPRGNCAVLLTTRHGNHPALQGAEQLDLQRFTKAEAETLVDEILGAETAAAQAEDTGRLFELVGYLPLALNVALRLAQKSGWTLAVLAEQLEEAGALTVLGDEARLRKCLNVTFETAYGSLPEELQEAFRTLALFNEGVSFDAAAFADTTGLEAAEAVGRLHQLAGRSLLDQMGEDRWSLHTLLREFAAGLPAVGENAWRGFARHYVEVLRAARNLYLQGKEEVVRGLALYDREGPHIRAGQAWAAARADEDEEAAQLCSDYPDAGAYVLDLRLHPLTLIRWLEAAADAAHRLGGKEVEGRHVGNLGNAYAALGETRQAIDYYQQALAIAREIGDRRNEGDQLGDLGNAYAALGETRQAIDYYQQALAIAREVGDRRNEGDQLGDLGNAYAALGETRQAIDYYEQALAITREIGNRQGEGVHLGNLGNVYASLGKTRQAIDYHEQALTIAREIGDRRNEGTWLGNLGLAYRALEEPRQAIDYLQRALAIAREIGDRRGEGTWLGNLGLVHRALGETQQTIDYCQQSLAIFREIGDRHSEATALANLGNAYEDLGEPARAREYWIQTLTILEAIEDPRADRARDLLEQLEG